MKEHSTFDLLNHASDEHMERTVLGALLLDGKAVAEATDRLVADDFSLDSHRRIFRCVTEMLRKNYGVDTSTVMSMLRSTGELAAIGGLEYLYALTEGIPHNCNIETYVTLLKDKALLRQAITAHHEHLDTAAAYEDDPRRYIEGTLARFQELLEVDAAIDIPSVGEYLDRQGDPEAIFEQMSAVDGTRVGFNQLDELTGGLQKGELIIVAARPSMGKTAWMCNSSAHMSIQDTRHTAVFSLEQKKKAIIRRMLSSLARIDASAIRKGELRSHERMLLLERREMLRQAPLYMDDTPGLTASRIRSKCARLKRTRGLDIVFIDQLSKVSMADCRERDFRLRIGEQTGAFKRMAQDLDVPVVLFNQLRRPDGKGEVVPRLSDLKESGNIEEDADVVILLHRPEYYDKSDESLKGKGQMIVAKNREGATETLQCEYNGRILRWEDTTAPAATQNSLDERTPW